MTTSIAIVGVAAELPSGTYSDKNLDHESFFEFLLNSGEAYERIPGDRFDISLWKGKGAGQVSVDRGAFLKGIDMFDNLEFGVSPKDARAMAPSSKKLLETSFLALLDSGINYRSRNVGCYTSGIVWDGVGTTDPLEFESAGSYASSPSMIANRVSYHLDLMGPSVPTDTACSSSLTAMHLAVQAVRRGECEAAVVGGCQLNYRLADWIHYSAGGLLAKDGKCKPFDASANGFSRGEGVVAVVIKPLEDALRDHDRIYATILGTAINSGGSGLPAGAPVAEAQCEAMKQAYKQAGRNPQEADFVECHATGTAKGDPTELGWVSEHFSREDELLVGSVKGNVGHLEITAFLASLSKVLSIFEHGIIPPNVNMNKRNPAIKWDEYKLRVPLEPTPLSHRSSDKSLISMASAGIGGANGHIVLESPPSSNVLSKNIPVEINGETPSHPVLLMAGGLSPRSVAAIADSIADISVGESYSKLLSMSTVLGRRSKQMTWRSFAVVEPGQSAPVKFSQASLSPRTKPPIVFVFCGQGPQHRDMGKELFRDFPVFQDSVLEMDEVYTKVTGTSMLKDYGLFDPNRTPTIELTEPWSIEFILPAMLIYQVALYDLLVSLGLKPDIVTGHSAGETAVVYACGAGSKAMALELAIARGKAYATLENTDSTMAAISCSPREATNLIKEARRDLFPEDVVEVACFNSPTAVTLSGKNKAIDRMVGLAEDKGIWCRKIRTRVPNHSTLMDGCKDIYGTLISDVFARYPGDHIPSSATVYSTVTGKPFSSSYDADYFWGNARGRVQFTQAIQLLAASHPSLSVVEMAPHPVLSSYVSSMVGESSSVLSPARRPKKGEPLMEHSRILSFLGEFTSLGHNGIDFTVLNGRACYEGQVILPSYPFALKSFPLWLDGDAHLQAMEPRNGPLNHKHLRISKETHPSLAEHVVRGEPIMPAAGYLEMAVEFGAPVLFDVNIHSILSLPSERPINVSVNLDGLHWAVESTSPQGTRTHADGYLSFDYPKESYPKLDLAKIRGRCSSHFNSDIYPSFAYFSSYGPLFQRIVNVSYNSDEALASINGLDQELMNDSGYYLHPAILDACFQLTAFKPLNGNYDPNVYYLPARVGTLLVHRPLEKRLFPAHVFAHITFKSWTPEAMQYDIAVVDDAGERLCTLESFEVARHRIWPYSDISRRFDVVYQPIGHPIRTKKQEIVQSTGEDTTPLYDLLDRFALAAQGNQSSTLPDSLSDHKKLNGSAVNGHHDCSGCPIHCQSAGSMDGDAPVLQNGHVNGEISIVDKVTRRKGHYELTEKLIIACESLLGNLQQRWPTHFELLERRKAGNPHENPFGLESSPHFAFALRDYMQALRNALSSFTSEGNRRLIRLFITSNNDLVKGKLPQLLADFPSFFFDVFVCNASEAMVINSQIGLSHFGEFDFAKPLVEQSLDANSFDLVVSFDPLPSNDRELAVQRLHQLLIPGGRLVMMEKNESAWETHRPGVEWYDYVFGAPELSDMVSRDKIDQLLSKYGLSPLTVFTNADVDPFHFVVECQKSSSQNLDVVGPLYDDFESFTFDYSCGEEIDLQWGINGLDPLQKLDIWVVAKAGKDGAAATGLTRALRREMLEWTIRLVIFPESFTSDMRQETLQKLPESVRHEPEIIITSEGDIRVPRMIPLSPPDIPRLASGPSIATELAENHVLVHIKTSSQHGSFSSFVGTVARSSVSGFEEGRQVAGLSTSLSGEYMPFDTAGLCAIPVDFTGDLAVLAISLAGYAAAVIAPSQRLVRQPQQFAALRILLTHCNTPVGRAISQFYSANGIKVVAVDDGIDVLGLSRLGLRSFDLVVSGYTDRGSIQVTRRLVCPGRGQLFLWNHEEEGLVGILQRAPWTIGYALQESLTRMKDKPQVSGVVVQTAITTHPPEEVTGALTRSLFGSTKTYLLLGGVGCLGAQIALWMYQRGARHLVLTSRQGRKSLEKASNLMARRVFQYLESRSELDMHFEAVDATSCDDMKVLIESLPTELGGCMMLAGLSADRLFVHLEEEDFANVFAPKINVMEVFADLVDIARLDFLVALTSSSGTFGIGGQANYSAANTALDGLTARYTNAFAFNAPGIFDTAFLLTGGIDAKSPAFNPIIEWAMSAEDMTRWLEDGIRKILSGHRFWIYIPDLNWEALDRTLGMPMMGKHLVPTQMTALSNTEVDEAEQMAEIVMKTLSIPREEFSREVPFTSYGLDSLSASRLAYSLHSIVEVTQIQLLADMTLEDLLKRLSEASKDKANDDGETKSHSPSVQTHIDAMEEMLAKYTKDFPERPVSILTSDVSSLDDSNVKEDVILLTGTTGVLGANILAQLIDSPDVKRVYAFNRWSKGPLSLMERQLHILEDQGLSLSYVDSEKLVLVEGNTASPDLGVTDDLMDDLLSSVTHIIHNAWLVDINAPLSMFEDAVKGTRVLVDFALKSKLPNPPALSFISTIGLYREPKEPVIMPEGPIDDPSVAVQSGYPESKWIAEHVLHEASQNTPLRTVVIRVGQMSGGVNGAWNTIQWVPSIVKSGLSLGCLPTGNDTVSWLPIHKGAAAIAEMRDAPTGTLHIAHPRPVTWESVFEPLASLLNVPLVPYAEWFERLESNLFDGDSHADANQLTVDNPALKLLDFFRVSFEVTDTPEAIRSTRDCLGLLPIVALDKSKLASKTLGDDHIAQLGKEDAASWIQHWREIGFLPQA